MHRDPIAGFRDPLIRIDVTPFIGVAMVLLLIHMVITPGSGHNYNPRTHTSVEMRNGMVTVHMGMWKGVFVDGVPSAGAIPLGELRQSLATALDGLPADRRGTVYLNAHYNVPYADVLSVLDAAADNGVRRVGLIVFEVHD